MYLTGNQQYVKEFNMRHKHIPYSCPRCTYESTRRSSMQVHFNRQKPCPAERADIDLTEDVKAFILKNRVYHLPAVIQSNDYPANITYNQTIMNFINTNMSTLEKLTSYTNYLKIDMQPLDQKIEGIYAENSNKLDDEDSNKLPQFELKIDDLLSVIDDISKSNRNHDDMNIIYDSDLNKINVLEEDGIWNESLVNQGLRTIIGKVQNGYLDRYECYVIRRCVQNRSAYERQCSFELLDEYYRFIATFDLQPFSKDKEDYVIIIEMNEREYTLSDRFYPRYVDIKKNLKGNEKNQIRKTVLDIIKRNSAKNVRTLNTNIYELFCKDAVFKQFMNGAISDNTTS